MDTAEKKNIEGLLSQVSSIVKKYDDIATVTGERFNIFNIVGIQTDEVKLHSRFLAELLNPKGSHGMKDVFLKLFIQRLNQANLIDRIDATEISSVTVQIEKHLGKIDKDTGGFIDILIQFGNYTIIIENKIFAGDQEGQLRRYYNYVKFFKNYAIVYLTLDGKEASEFTTKNNIYKDELINPILLSYQNDIKDWLEACRKEATNHPLVRETIAQYINLIKYLTGQTMNNDMENEIVENILKSGDNLKSAIQIANSINNIRQRLFIKFADELGKKVLEKMPELTIEISKDFGLKFQGISFKLPNKSDEFVFFGFLINYSYCYLEIVNNNNGKDGKSKKIENVRYYKDRLAEVTVGWGKIENTENAWHGDWVCKYENKMDKWMKNGNFLFDIADDKINDKVEEIANDIILLLVAVKNKPILH